METRHKRIDFRDLSDVQLPRFLKNKRKITAQALFPVDKEPASRRVKIHYIGYGVKYDEWKDESEIEILDNNEPSTEKTELTAP